MRPLFAHVVARFRRLSQVRQAERIVCRRLDRGAQTRREAVARQSNADDDVCCIMYDVYCDFLYAV